MAYGIMQAILPMTLTSMPRAARDLYEYIRELARAKAGREGLSIEDVEVSQREIRELNGMANTTLKRNLHVLVDYEYVRESGSFRRGSRRGYRVVADENLELVDLSAIPTPEVLAARALAEGIAL